MALPTGTCTGTVAIQNEELEERTYSLEDAIELRSLIYTGAKIIRGEDITIHEDTKDKKRIYREDFNVEFESPATGGRAKDECGGFRGQGKYSNTNKYIKSQYMTVEVKLCYKKLIGTWKQSRLNRGAGRAEENTSLNDFVLSRIIRDLMIQTDKLIWHGDWKGPEKKLAHYDGFIKRTALAAGGSIAHVERFTFAGLQAGDHIEGYAGGVKIDIPFTTSLDNTITLLNTLLAGLNDPWTGDPMYTLVLNTTSDFVQVTANRPGIPNEISLAITDGSGVDRCGLANSKGVGTVAKTEITANNKGDSPILIPYVEITSDNVLKELEKMYIAIADTNADLLNLPNFKLHVSTKVKKLLDVATSNTSVQVPTIKSLLGEGQIVEQPYLRGSIMFASHRDNLHFGTDLISDMENFEQWVDKYSQEVLFRGEMMQNVQIDAFSEVFANLEGHPFDFQPAMPDNFDN